MQYLSQLASMGHTIVASIHQPRENIFNSFKKVAVLSEGHQLYFGLPSLCVDWFEENLHIPYDYQRDGTVADWVVDTVSVGFNKPAALGTAWYDILHGLTFFS